MAMRRRTYHFSGRVQGVGFRYTANAIAADYDVRGYVRNLPDGRVELVMEGPDDEMDAVVNTLRQHMDHFIQGMTTDTSPATGEFEDFTVRGGSRLSPPGNN